LRVVLVVRVIKIELAVRILKRLKMRRSWLRPPAIIIRAPPHVIARVVHEHWTILVGLVF